MITMVDNFLAGAWKLGSGIGSVAYGLGSATCDWATGGTASCEYDEELSFKDGKAPEGLNNNLPLATLEKKESTHSGSKVVTITKSYAADNYRSHVDALNKYGQCDSFNGDVPRCNGPRDYIETTAYNVFLVVHAVRNLFVGILFGVPMVLFSGLSTYSHNKASAALFVFSWQAAMVVQRLFSLISAAVHEDGFEKDPLIKLEILPDHKTVIKEVPVHNKRTGTNAINEVLTDQLTEMASKRSIQWVLAGRFKKHILARVAAVVNLAIDLLNITATAVVGIISLSFAIATLGYRTDLNANVVKGAYALASIPLTVFVRASALFNPTTLLNTVTVKDLDSPLKSAPKASYGKEEKLDEGNSSEEKERGIY